jgi:NAD(P)-dependent dehydrogenase (short-subunit alcohol dehydrogenase family)
MAESSNTVLITGCSSGIGRATAERLAQGRWTVYATARRLDSIADLEGRGCELLALDVCDEESMRAAVEAVEQAEGAVGVLVNNAGYSQDGPIEEVRPEDVRRQFETNVFGLIRMTQLVLPAMRRAGSGKVVNIGSMGGKLTFPGAGLYHATKYSVEAISDALRFEVQAFGIDVILVEPGFIKTRFGETAVGTLDPDATQGPYAEFKAGVARATLEAYEGPLSRLGAGPEAVARTIERAISRRRPRARYPVTPSARILIGQRRLAPDRVWDLFLRTQFPVPRKQ